MYKNYTRKKPFAPPGQIQQILRIMKLTTFIIFIAFMQVSAATLAQRLTIKENTITLRQLFNEINKQTSYSVVWSASQVDGDRLIPAGFNNLPLLEVLNQSLSKANLSYTIEDKTVVIKEKEQSLQNKIRASLNLSISISGRVIDETGQPIPGANVKVKDNNNNGTTTDAKGQFSLLAPDNNSIIVFSFVGYESQELPAKDIGTSATITLKASVNNLREVVVNQGYYTRKEELNTGNIARVSGEDIAKQPGIDPIEALEGRIPGLSIQQTSGIPGSNTTVRLRGQNSLANGNNPLYIVDGVPFSSTSLTNSYIGGGALGYLGDGAGYGMSPFNTIDGADIENIEVLKDADATAIYGSRGANGVILITTKKGKPGDTKVIANVNSGVGNVTRMIKLMNTQQYLQMRHQAFANDGQTPSPYDSDVNGDWDTTRYTNWQKVFIGGTAKYTNAQASLSGGNANTQFLLGGGYNRQTTVYPGDYSDAKASVHMNINHTSIDQKFRVSASAAFVNDNNVLPPTDFTGILTEAPDAPALYDANGNINWQNGTFYNPISSLLENATAITNTLTGHLDAGYEILPGLQLQNSIGYTKTQMDQSIQSKGGIFYGPIYPSERTNNFSTSNSSTWIIEPQLSYSKKISNGKLDILLGTSYQQISQYSIAQLASGFLSDALIPNVAAASSITIAGNVQSTQYHYAAIYSRIGYNWEEKYLINLTARRDGSSRFGPQNQFGNFGAIGAGWIFSKEKFMQKDQSILSFGKLRVSYGTTGNDQLTDYQFLSTYSPYSTSTYQGISTLQPTRIANPYFGWEVVKKLEGGVDLGFLKDRIDLAVSYYRNRTGNQLVGQPLPATTGFTTIQSNLPAVVQNTGVELVLNTTNINGKSFSWSTSFNFSIPRNKIVSFPGLAGNPGFNTRYEVGKSAFAVASYHYTGFDSQTGLYTFEDVNHDGVIDSHDKEFLKQVAQNYFGGFQNSISYKNWHFDFLFQFVKQTALIPFFGVPGNFSANQPLSMLNPWQKPGDQSTVQMYTQSGGAVATAYGKFSQSDGAITDASFIRLKNISLSYSLPAEFQKKLHLKGTRLYLQAQNLFTITKYQGLDPETQGINLPPLRMITTGIQFGL